MRRRKWHKRVLILAAALGALIAAITIISRPGPDSPKWWLRRAVVEAHGVKSGRPDANLLLAAVRAHASIGDLAGARRIIRDMEAPGSSLLLSLRRKAARLLAKIGIGTGRVTLPRRSVFLGYTWLPVIEAQAKAGDIAGAKRTADEANLDGSQHSHALMHITKAQVAAGDIDAAERTAAAIPYEEGNDWHRIRAITAVACARAIAGDIPAAIALAKRDPEPTPQDGGRFRIYTFIVRALAETGRIEQAKSVAREFQPRAHYEILTAQISSGDLKGAEVTLNDIPVGGPQSRACRKMAYALAKAGKVAEALALAETSDGARHKEGVLLGACTGRAASGDPGGAIAMVQEFFPWKKAFAPYAIAKELFEAGDIEGARAMVEYGVSQREREGRRAAFQWRAASQWRADFEWRANFRSTEVMSICLSLAESYHAAGNADAYAKWIEVAKGITKDGSRGDVTLTYPVAATQAKTGDLTGAEATVPAFIPRGREDLRLRGLGRIAKGYAQGHDQLKELQDFIKALPTPQERAWAYLGAGQGLIKKAEEQ